MPKGLRATLHIAVLCAVSLDVSAQVYRCETASGVTYSDMPCGDSSEEIVVQGDVVDMKGVGSGDAMAPEPGAPGQEQDLEMGGAKTLDEFLVMLRQQREEQLSIIDRQLAQLRAQSSSIDFQEMTGDEQDEITRQIASLEANRASIVSGYESLIQEAERRQ
jgi:hypothetical protein